MARPYELRSSRHVVSRVCLFMSLLVGSTSFLVAPRTGHGALTPRTSASGRGVEGRPTRQDTFPVFALRRASLLRTRHLEMSADAMPGPDVLGMDDIIFERYVGSVSYTESVTIEGDGPTLTAEGALRAGTDLVATVGTATVRVFAGSLDNIGMVTRGEDVRITLKEFPPPSEDDGVDLAANEVRALQALAPQGSTTLPFPWLYGELKMDFAAGDSLEGDEQWTAQIGTAPPRKGSRWLVYAYDGDGGNTLLSFSRPTAVRIAAAVEQRGGRRSMALAPLPRDVPWLFTSTHIPHALIQQTPVFLPLSCLQTCAHAGVCALTANRRPQEIPHNVNVSWCQYRSALSALQAAPTHALCRRLHVHGACLLTPTRTESAGYRRRALWSKALSRRRSRRLHACMRQATRTASSRLLAYSCRPSKA
jgi:hypothetical protein